MYDSDETPEETQMIDEVLTVVVVEVAIRELADRGLVTIEGGAAATPKAVAMYDQLRADGFKPLYYFAREYLRQRYETEWEVVLNAIALLWAGKL